MHPDIEFGSRERYYAGPGWSAYLRLMPIEVMMLHGGKNASSYNDRVGVVQDPEDPRHPVFLEGGAGLMGMDGSKLRVTLGSYEKSSKASRLMQVLYESYLEPFSMNRVCAQLHFYEKVPNHHHGAVDASADYLGQTATLVGEVLLGMSTCVMEGVTIKADTNCVYIAEGVQILENTCIVSDAPTNVLAYRRNELINPYQQWDGMEGVTRVMANTIIEPNCFLDSCSIGSFNRIGHNTKILKGVTTGIMVHILPGSVVTPDTSIGDGEIWGGAPAVKVGEVSKYEWKRPYYASLLHKEAVTESYRNMSRYGDQVVHYVNAMGELETLMVNYENHISEGVKHQIRDFEEGHEPFNHMITRISQGWSPSIRPSESSKRYYAPLPSVKLFAEHNNDSSDSELHGTYKDLTNIFNDYCW